MYVVVIKDTVLTCEQLTLCGGVFCGGVHICKCYGAGCSYGVG